ncbi:MFS transporter [Falsiroseomonas ponticola]|uniref:MFS transporter n=1 Tax=Falsiroseomonas ponticola TaxID=2786951 RepID=UPI0019325170|nr:MFS transporter [Roseomonas ponticola]
MRLLQPLRVPALALLWGGLSLSAIGDQLYAVALSWIATDVFGPAAGYLGALQALTVLLVAILAGGMADRWDALRCMLGADLLRAAALLVPIALGLATGSPTAIGLGLAVVLLAVGQALFQPALQAMLPRLARDKALLPAANALFDGTERSARLVGPGLLALLAGLLPMIHFLTINAASFLLSAAALLVIMRRHRPDPVPPREAPRGIGILRGIRAMRRHPLLGYVLAGAGPLNGAWYAVFFLGLPLLLQRDGQGIGSYGVLIATYGAANLLSNIVCGSLAMPARPQFRMFASSMLVGAGMACFAGIGALPPAWQWPAWLAAAFASGLAGPLKDIPVAVLRQSRIPAPDIPAATRAQMVANNGGTLVAMLAMPSLMQGDRLGPAVLGCGVVAFAVGAIGFIRFARWREAA